MDEWRNLKVIAYMYTDFPKKFGIPRQSGLADVKGKIVFEPEYRALEALRGLLEYSHLWVIWGFSQNFKEGWHPTVRPPRLGGNIRVGVFASRSPFRPNPIGLSCVKLDRIEYTKSEGAVLHVRGVDMADKTPIYDMKPYLPYTDCRFEARGGFAHAVKDYALKVDFPERWQRKVPEEHKEVLVQVLMQDPRPAYQNDPARIYAMEYAGMKVEFYVDGMCLRVCGVKNNEEGKKRV